jgi:NAD(P)-dependent dehydrogenase (short-subunit alcohol dehydrogenase family)
VAGAAEVVALPQAAFDPDALVRAVLDRFGRLDVCCALTGATGTGAGDGPLLDLTDAAWRRCLEANLGGPFRLLRSAGRAMVATGTPGVLVALSSHAAQTPAAGTGAVGAARAAVQHLVAVLAAELGRHGIRCAAVAPLAVAPTELFGNPGLVALAERTAGSLDAWLAGSSPLGRAQQPGETAAVIDFLCSDAASYLSGITVPVTGGAR